MRNLKFPDTIGYEHQKWLVDLWRRYNIRQEPILDSSSKILAEPLFWFKKDDSIFACFGNETSEPQQDAIFSYHILNVGEEPQ